MAQLKDLIVNGSGRIIGDLSVSGTIYGTVTNAQAINISNANTTKLYLVGANATSGTQKTLYTDSNIYANTTAGQLRMSYLNVNGDSTSYRAYINGTSYLGGNTRIQSSTPNVWIKDTNTGADTYAILRFGNSSTDDGAYIFLNGPSRTNDGGNNMLTIRNNVGNLRLNNSTINTGNLTVGDSTLNTTYKLYVNGTDYFKGDATHEGNILASADNTYNIGSSTSEFQHLYSRTLASRHLDASAVYSTDHSLYIGYGASGYTNKTLFYYSSSTSARTQFAELNSNGLYALTRFGVNGQSTSYNFYVNGTSYFNGNTTHNGVDYFANGTTYYINNSGDGNFRSLGVAQTAGTGQGISLYSAQTGTTAPTYGLMFAKTSSFGTHGGVTSDWATYFTMSDTTTRGWIFRRGSTNVASISGTGVFTGSLSGNATTADTFSSNATVALTGDATGTSAGSTKGWSVPVTLASSGVTAGSYGPSGDVSPAHKGTFSVPYITVDAKGRVTAASTKTITLPADNNTTYSAGTGLSLSGTTFNHSNSITAGTVSEGGSTRTLAFGGTFKIPSVTYDAQGHITSTTTTTLTLPANPDTNTDTKVTNTLGTTTKFYITGTTSTTTNTGTQYFDTGVYVSTTAGELVATKFTGPLTGNVTGNCSGSSGSCTGTAANANKVNHTLTIGSVTYDGSADVTIPIYDGTTS